jgi:hypothetical protein
MTDQISESTNSAVRPLPTEADDAMVKAFVDLALHGDVLSHGGWPGYARDQWRVMVAAAPPASSFQERVQPWLMACFGKMIADDREERNHRFLEEALELVQSCGCTASEAHQLVDYVFGREIGEPRQEVGGVMVTLAALCLANAIDMHDAGEVELARIWTKVEAIRAKQAAKPKHSPLPQLGDQHPLTDRVIERFWPDVTTTAGKDDLRRQFDALVKHSKATAIDAVLAAASEPNAIGDVAAERSRQVSALGWTPEHDDCHDRDLALPRAAACYALAGTGENGPFWITRHQTPQQVWPYRWEWKPKDRRTNLVRAAALLIAEIERIDRVEKKEAGK